MKRSILTFVAMTASCALGAPSTSTYSYTKSPIPLEQWQQEYPVESKILNLFPDYKFPKIKLDDGSIDSFLILYANEQNVLNLAPEQIDLKPFLKVETMNNITSGFKSREIGSSELMQNLIANRQPVNAFEFCKETTKNTVWKMVDGKRSQVTVDEILEFNRPKLVTDLGHLTGRKWCEGTANSKCIESCYMFNSTWRVLMKSQLKGLTFMFGNSRKAHDPGIAMQSEVDYFENEVSSNMPLRQLTKIDSPVVGVIELNIFYINQLIEYGKVLIVLQRNPDAKNPNTTIMSSYAVLPIHKHTWEGYPEPLKTTLQWTVMGLDPKYNFGESIESGLPNFIYVMLTKVAAILEKR